MMMNNGQYQMEEYHKKSLFYSFLPGISGIHGIPMWCYYLNRGQAIASFGVQDKDHSILEFYPAHQAAQRTPMLGFRTFFKIGTTVKELFECKDDGKCMNIGMNSISIEDKWKEENLKVEIEYETVPEEPFAALMREVIITNCGAEEKEVEILDGLTELVPYGVTSESMKEMGQTAKAWMEVKNLNNRIPYFKVRASMEDNAKVEKVNGAVFGIAGEADNLLFPVVDRNLIFLQDTALRYPYGFAQYGVEGLRSMAQNVCNEVPCCYFIHQKRLKPGESICIRELYGMAEQEEVLASVKDKFQKEGWFEEKQIQSKALAEHLTEPIACKTANPIFDAYSRQTFLDNLLRGGYLERIGESEVLYIYSRKHGDMERDYNFFSMEPEYYSQGNGNFRDVNQNRRCDVQFFPYVGEMNLRRFYNALQINGYNPLGVERITYLTCDKEEKTPGQIYEELANKNRKIPTEEEFAQALSACTKLDGYQFIEGYWSDHWTYNLDLLESYLTVFPDKKEEVIFGERIYTYRQAEQRLLPRKKRYQETPDGIRQYRFLVENPACEKDMPLKDAAGNPVQVSLIEKLLSLAIVKMAALDPYAMGIEMEGGKPGWYDALNGLPGLFGSSMAEAYELERMIGYMEEQLQGRRGQFKLPEELADLADALTDGAIRWKEELESDGATMHFWNQINDAKEQFWEKTAVQVQGEYRILETAKVQEFLEISSHVLALGRKKSRRISNGVPATYYYYELIQYEKEEDGIRPLAFGVRKTPDFLEGAVHSLKLKAEAKNRGKIYQNVRESRLYDRELRMYKVNASLSEASFELGRACAFTPGWLENESVWLHMEYKYLLELLKTEMYEEFSEDWKNAGIPFLDEEIYGRIPLENSSFLVSSVNPNPAVHGKGFVARLSGSTAEFLQIWQIMMFGAKPFVWEEGILKLEFTPFLPKYLLEGTRQVKACFLGNVTVVYCLPDEETILPGNYCITQYTLCWKDKNVKRCTQIYGTLAEAVRSGEIDQIIVQIERID